MFYEDPADIDPDKVGVRITSALRAVVLEDSLNSEMVKIADRAVLMMMLEQS